jgi:sporulation protein YlmC with PRC-barrel domain
MLRSIKQLFGRKLGGYDSEIGHVKDFYFDGKHWGVRYVVVDTGSWIPGRLVLISPHAFDKFPQGGRTLPVNLTRRQIEDSPAIEAHKPVSRQYEEEYYRYYGWPYYWQGNEVWGMSGFPILSKKSKPFRGEPRTDGVAKPQRGDARLRSARDVIGYQIQTGGEIVGHVTDFMMDDKSWAICHLVVNIGNRFSGNKVLLSPDHVDRISWDESKVYVNVTKEVILQTPPSDGLIRASGVVESRSVRSAALKPEGK